MAEKMLNTRIQLKYDSYENWQKSAIELKAGEIAIAKLAPFTNGVNPAEVTNDQHPLLMKVGPGLFKNLPWVSALAADVYAWAKKETPDWSDFPALPITVTPQGTGSFVSSVEYNNGNFVVHYADVDLDAYATDEDLKNYVTKEEYKDDVKSIAVDSEAQLNGSALYVSYGSSDTNRENALIGLNLDNSGNVKLAQSTTGLKATVDLSGYEAVGAETRAKAYVDQKFTDANLSQYTTEKEVKDIVDAVVVGAVEGDTLTGLANLVEYINTHGGEAAEMASAIDALEGRADVIEGKPAYAITASQVSNWDGEVGAKAAAQAAQKTADDYATAHASDYTNTQIDNAIKNYTDSEIQALDTAIAALGANKTLSVLTQTDGLIAATVVDIAIPASQVTDFATEVAKIKVAAATAADSAVKDGAGNVITATYAKDADLHAIAKSGNVNDLVQTAGDVLVFNCGTASTVI